MRHGAGDPPKAQQVALDMLDRTGLLGLLARSGLLASTIDKIATDSLQYVPFTQLANLTGTPAMSVPLHWTADGLPLGVQFVAPFGREDRLLQLAAQLEQARPWFGRMPAWVAGLAAPCRRGRRRGLLARSFSGSVTPASVPAQARARTWPSWSASCCSAACASRAAMNNCRLSRMPCAPAH